MKHIITIAKDPDDSESELEDIELDIPKVRYLLEQLQSYRTFERESQRMIKGLVLSAKDRKIVVDHKASAIYVDDFDLVIEEDPMLRATIYRVKKKK